MKKKEVVVETVEKDVIVDVGEGNRCINKNSKDDKEWSDRKSTGASYIFSPIKK